MVIREARIEDLKNIMIFYDMMCQELGKADFLPEGNKGGFPPEEMVVASIKKRDLWIGEEEDCIAAAYIMNHQADASYRTIKWQIDADQDEVVILHALRIAPSYTGKGYAKKLVLHAVERAKERGQKAIRLDCIEGDDPAHNLYLSCGFQYMGTVGILYEDIGVERNFLLFELVI